MDRKKNFGESMVSFWVVTIPVFALAMTTVVLACGDEDHDYQQETKEVQTCSGLAQLILGSMFIIAIADLYEDIWES